MGGARSRPHKDDYSVTLRVSDICKQLIGHQSGAPLVKSGDVLLFRGSARTSRLIEWFTWCPYSHIGIVLMYNGEICLLESVGHVDALHCKLGNRPKDGVRLVSLEQKLNNYLAETGRELADATTQICFLPLHLQESQHSLCEQHLLNFARHTLGLGYQHSSQSLLHAAFHAIPAPSLSAYAHLSSDNPRKEYQCAELVAAALRAMGVLRLNFPCEDMTPKSFINGSVLDTDYVHPTVVLSQEQFHITVRADPPARMYTVANDGQSVVWDEDAM
jgi:hypothetical protein